MRLSDIKVAVRGGGDLGSGVAWRLHNCGFKVFITESEEPLAVRRKVAFCEAVYDGYAVVEGIRAVLVKECGAFQESWARSEIPLMIDPLFTEGLKASPTVLVDAIMAKKNLGTSLHMAELVIALGPGFEAGNDCHFVIETNRGHYLGRIIDRGSAEPDTGIPGQVLGIGKERVLRAPASGRWLGALEIGSTVSKGDIIGTVGSTALLAPIYGTLRGIIRTGTAVSQGLKIGDIDPRRDLRSCFTVSDKSLAVAGGVLEAILRRYGRQIG